MSGSYNKGTLTLHTNKKQYLIAYSKADLVKFPTRESFCDTLTVYHVSMLLITSSLK